MSHFGRNETLRGIHKSGISHVDSLRMLGLRELCFLYSIPGTFVAENIQFEGLAFIMKVLNQTV